jgi:hypothetical protein
MRAPLDRRGRGRRGHESWFPGEPGGLGRGSRREGEQADQGDECAGKAEAHEDGLLERSRGPG